MIAREHSPTIMPDPEDGTRCDTPLGEFRVGTWVEGGVIQVIIFAADFDLLYHEDAGPENSWQVFPTFDLRAIIEDAIDLVSNDLGEIDEDEAAVIDVILSQLLDRVRTMPRIKKEEA